MVLTSVTCYIYFFNKNLCDSIYKTVSQVDLSIKNTILRIEFVDILNLIFER